MTDWLLIIFVFVNGHWATADYLIEDWTPSVYQSEQACIDTRDVAKEIEKRVREESPGDIIPRRFECVPR